LFGSLASRGPCNTNDPTDYPQPDIIVNNTNLQTAIDSITKDYQIILIKPGTYSKIHTDSNDPEFLLLGEKGPTQTIIDANQRGRAFKIQNNVVADGLSFINGKYYDGAGIYINNASPTLRNIIVRNNTDRYELGAIYIINNSNPLIENCIVKDNYMKYGGAVYIKYGGQATFNHCTFHNNRARETGDGFRIYEGQATITNSILWNGGNDEIALGTRGQIDITHSIIQGGYLGTANLNTDPQLTPEGYITENSPAINKGIITTLTHDITNTPRTNTPDIGANERPTKTTIQAPPEQTTPPNPNAINFNETTIQSYHTNQDKEPNAYTIENTGTTIHFTGNTWKAITHPYQITSKTKLKFEFKSDKEQPEINSIGLDNDLTETAFLWLSIFFCKTKNP